MPVFTYTVGPHGTRGKSCLLSLLEDGEVVYGGVFERRSWDEAHDAASAYGDGWVESRQDSGHRAANSHGPHQWFEIKSQATDTGRGWKLDLHSDGAQEDGGAFKAGSEGHAEALQEGYRWLESR